MKVRIPKEELKLGMHIDRAILEKANDGKTKVNFIRNYLIDSQEKLDKIQNSNIKFVFIDTAKAKKIDPAKEPEPVTEPEPVKEEPPEPEPVVEKIEDVEPEPEPEEPEEEEEELDNFDDDDKKKGGTIKARVPFEEELEVAKEVKTKAVETVRTLLEDAAVGKSFKTEDAKEEVNGMVKSVFRNKDALLSLTRLKSFDEYTFTHCVNVTVLSIALAGELGFSKEEIDVIGLGAMMHDVGKMRVPDAVLNKPGKLTPEERVEIQKHTVFAKEILEEKGDIPEKAILMAYEHHEKADGSGYPNGKTADQIQRESVVNAVADVYDALTSARVYKPGMPPPHALSFIKSRAESEFDPEYVDKFIETIGIYPVGSIVEFNSGQIGVVKEVNRDDLYKPFVILVMNAKKQKIAEKLIEPAKYETNDLKIVRYHDPEGLGLDVEKIIQTAETRI
ncbi:MAG: HD-GYP domain-containing protein [bacterium]|nr:HD-GYP domain-containing protein [bacterium]